jgi:hypothetical protein
VRRNAEVQPTTSALATTSWVKREARAWIQSQQRSAGALLVKARIDPTPVFHRGRAPVDKRESIQVR